MEELVKWAVGAVSGIAIGAIAVHSFWRLMSAIRIWRAGHRRLRSLGHVLWRDPGVVERLDLAAGPGGHDGAPRPPFRFIEEHFGGSQPCVSLRDAAGRRWRVKWGDEVQVEALATRLVWACGYFVETTYYVPEGRVDGVG